MEQTKKTEEQKKKRKNQFVNEVVGRVSNTLTYNKTKKENQYFILKLQIKDKNDENKYYPFWYFTQTKDVEKEKETLTHLIHQFTKIKYEQIPAANGTMANVIKCAAVWDKETKKFYEVINVYKMKKEAEELVEAQKAVEKEEELVEEVDFEDIETSIDFDNFRKDASYVEEETEDLENEETSIVEKQMEL